MARRKTATSAFGSSGREAHDASAFYGRRLYTGQATAGPEDLPDNPLPPEAQDALYCHSSESMPELPDRSVHLMVTSPPYNAGKVYDQDLSLGEYRGLLRRVMAEVMRVLVVGGRACINIANLGRRPYIPLAALVVQDMLDLGFIMRGEVVWDKGASAGASTAWGSYCSASNPVLRDQHEYILLFSKSALRLRGPRGRSLTPDDFLEATRSVWRFPAESAKRVGHPAPFPLELPRRLIALLSFAGQVVLDPFCGSGTTCVAAKRLGRRFVGYDTCAEYIALAQRRLELEGER